MGKNNDNVGILSEIKKFANKEKTVEMMKLDSKGLQHHKECQICTSFCRFLTCVMCVIVGVYEIGTEQGVVGK